MTLTPPAAPALPPILHALGPLQLALAVGCTQNTARPWVEPLRDACARFGIHTPARLAAFLAQIGHESGSFAHTSEIWGPTPAQSRYEGRADLGNTQPGDGSRFRGHGLIQITGRANHAQCRDALRAAGYADCPDFEGQPQLLAQPPWAVVSAAWFWRDRGCNDLADVGKFEAITRRINGGLNGHADRVARLARARKALGIA